jgi:hypothetical protein
MMVPVVESQPYNATQTCTGVDECEARATELGLTLGADPYGFESASDSVKGCYTYDESSAYFGAAFFGSNGTMSQMESDLAGSRLRIRCAADAEQRAPTSAPSVAPLVDSAARCYWSFDEIADGAVVGRAAAASGAAFRSSERLCSATRITAAAVAHGVRGTVAAQFAAGAGSLVAVAYNASLNPAANFSASLWARADAVDDDDDAERTALSTFDGFVVESSAGRFFYSRVI